MLLMLEDDRDRIKRFAILLASQKIEFAYRRTANAFILAYESLDTIPELIALDHDLFVDHEGDPDPGDGRDYIFAYVPLVSSHPLHYRNRQLAPV